MLAEVSRRVSLRFEEGSFGFRNLVPTISDEQMYDLGRALNEFQVDEAKKIYKIQTFQLV